MDINSIIKKFTNKKLKKIVNVYQLNYLNGKSPGLGDFIRGSFCFLQISKLLNLDFDIDISNHPISKYIENTTHIEGLNYNNIVFYSEYNRDSQGNSNYENKPININYDFLIKTIEWLNLQECETFGFFSNAFPCFNRHNKDGINLINSKFQPTDFMKTYLDITLNELGLEKKKYDVIHFRIGDEYLVNNKKLDEKIIYSINKIINDIINPNHTYVIISDSNDLKEYLKIYPNFYISIKNIEHLGGECIRSIETDGVMNTILDFFMMSHSNKIISLSVYGHVSGFSKYCGVLYNIPSYYFKINI